MCFAQEETRGSTLKHGLCTCTATQPNTFCKPFRAISACCIFSERKHWFQSNEAFRQRVSYRKQAENVRSSCDAHAYHLIQPTIHNTTTPNVKRGKSRGDHFVKNRKQSRKDFWKVVLKQNAIEFVELMVLTRSNQALRPPGPLNRRRKALLARKEFQERQSRDPAGRYGKCKNCGRAPKRLPDRRIIPQSTTKLLHP